jgi:hypothetical protein
MERKTWFVMTFFWALMFGSSIIYTVPEPSWSQSEIAKNVDQRFMDLEMAGPEINLIYRNSTNSGVILRTMDGESSIFDSLKNFLQRKKWKSPQIIDETPGSGSYLSATEINGELMVAYQDASIGQESVVLASKDKSNWSKQIIDDVNDGGVNVGMYTSLTSYQGKPVTIYHSPTQGLKSAMKLDGQWDREVVAEKMGWFTDSASCGQKVFAAYRGRNSNQLRISTFDGSWSTELINTSVKSSLNIDQKDCRLHLLYLTEEDEIVYRSPEGDENILADSAYSRVSIDTSQGIRTSYYDYGEGMFYAEKNGEGWERKQLTNSSNTAQYNDIAVDGVGNVHVIFAQDSDIIHAENNLGRISNIEKFLNYTRIFLVIVLLVLVANLFRKTRIRKDGVE